MSYNPDAVQRYETAAPAPTRSDFNAAPIKYTADSASASAAINTTRADAANGNFLANMHGGRIRGRHHRRLTSKLHTTRSKRLSRRVKRRCISSSSSNSKKSRSTVRKQGDAFKTRVNRRLRIRMMQRRIKKRINNSSTLKLRLRMHGGIGGTDNANPVNSNSNSNSNYVVPQHGHSCAAGETNCAGNEAAVLLSAKNQMTAYAHGDSVSA